MLYRTIESFLRFRTTLRTRGVIFDLFHTLTGPEPQHPASPSISEILRVDAQSWRQLVLKTSRWRLSGEEPDPKLLLLKLARELNSDITEDQVQEALTVRTHRFRSWLKAIPQANIQTIKLIRAKRLQLGLISNADSMEIAGWADSPIAGLFNSEVFSCFAGCVKPEAEIYHRCMDALGVDPEDCLYVGDGSSAELAGAKAVGMSTVLLSEIGGDDLISDYRVETIPQILSLLGQGFVQAGAQFSSQPKADSYQLAPQ